MKWHKLAEASTVIRKLLFKLHVKTRGFVQGTFREFHTTLITQVFKVLQCILSFSLLHSIYILTMYIDACTHMHAHTHTKKGSAVFEKYFNHGSRMATICSSQVLLGAYRSLWRTLLHGWRSYAARTLFRIYSKKWRPFRSTLFAWYWRWQRIPPTMWSHSAGDTARNPVGATGLDGKTSWLWY